ncbi:hypothetical protein ACIGZJ_03155 [Kitasatospora sp. NPDC052868]|uniref:hypothetical protein n=1 Tax=Kitasatospora sp. NPDC052868 TaxID=3364060 RepID=UPI0037CBAFE0
MKNLTKRIAAVGAATIVAAGLTFAVSPSASAADQSKALVLSTPDWYPNDYVSMSSNWVHLKFQSDGNLVLYRNWDGAVLWASGTSGWGLTRLSWSATGYIKLYKGNALACTIGDVAAPGGRVAVQDDGNLVIYKSNGAAVWDTGTWNNQVSVFNNWCV